MVICTALGLPRGMLLLCTCQSESFPLPPPPQTHAYDRQGQPEGPHMIHIDMCIITLYLQANFPLQIWS